MGQTDSGVAAVLAVHVLGPAVARRLTDEVKADVGLLREKLLRLYEGRAFKALGYESWKAYWEAEFDSHWVTGYRQLEAAKVDRAVSELANGPVPESHARAAGPLVDDPEALRGVYAEVVAEGKPTAARIAEKVDARVGREPQKAVVVCGSCGQPLPKAATPSKKKARRSTTDMCPHRIPPGSFCVRCGS